MHSENEPGAEEGNRRKGAGVQAANPGLREAWVCVWRLWWELVSGGRPLEWSRGGMARPTASVSSPQWLSRPGYSLSGTPEFKQLRGWGWSRTREKCLIQHWRPCGGGGGPKPCWGTSLPSPPGESQEVTEKAQTSLQPSEALGLSCPSGLHFLCL